MSHNRVFIINMNEKFQKKKVELLQKVADFIYLMLEVNMENQKHFDFWMWQGLSLDYWCKERGIYLE